MQAYALTTRKTLARALLEIFEEAGGCSWRVCKLTLENERDFPSPENASNWQSLIRSQLAREPGKFSL